MRTNAAYPPDERGPDTSGLRPFVSGRLSGSLDPTLHFSLIQWRLAEVLNSQVRSVNT